MKQDTRRGVRTFVFAVLVLAFVAFIGWIIGMRDELTVRHIAYGLLIIVGIAVIGYVAENVTQRIAFKAGLDGIEGEIGNDKE